MLRLPRNRLPKSNKPSALYHKGPAFFRAQGLCFFMMMFAEDYFSMGCEGFQSL